MNPAEKIIAALEDCKYGELIQIAAAAKARAKQIKAEFKEQAEAMGLVKPRKPRGEQDAI